MSDCEAIVPIVRGPAVSEMAVEVQAGVSWRVIAPMVPALAGSLPRLNSVLPTAYGASSIHERKHVPLGRRGRFHSALRWTWSIFGGAAACTSLSGSLGFL